MSFLTPLFLAGLGAVAVPILIHLIQRERKRVVQFPSLMFLQRIPYQSVRRRRIRHWFLLAMRVAAIALLVLAFARPFFRQSAFAAAATGGSREVVILLDQSASMGYGDHWQKAKDAAHRVVAGLSGEDRATLVLFGRNAEENMRATPERTKLDAAINAAKVGSDGTRFGPALKLASSILSRSNLQRKEAVLISDFQKGGWGSSEDARFADKMTLTTMSVASADTSNISVPSVTFARSAFSGQERVAVTAGLANRSDAPAKDIPVVLTVDGHEIETKTATIGAHASSSVTFATFTVAEANIRGSVKAGTDPLPADNTFHFVVSPSEPLSVAVLENGDRAGESLYLTKALAIGTTPTFQADVVPVSRVTPATFDKRSVIVFNDTVVPSAPRSADFSSAHIFRYRTLDMLDPSSRVLARYEDGGIAAAERRTGAGRVIVLTTTLDDSWTDLPVKPIYLPLVQQTVRYLARYEQTPSWMTVGQVIDLASTSAKIRTDRIVVAPDAQRITQRAGSPGLLELSEQGIYEVRAAGATSGRPQAIAVNIDPAEADLTSLDPKELVAAVTGHATPDAVETTGPGAISREDNERRQALWWYLLFAGLLLLAAETVISNRLSQKEKFL
jgi:hypothetical protein